MSGIIDTPQLITRLRELRKARKISAQALSDRLAELGQPMARTVIANMESGRRATISVDEAAAICRVLDVDLRVVLSDEPMPVATKVWVV